MDIAYAAGFVTGLLTARYYALRHPMTAKLLPNSGTRSSTGCGLQPSTGHAQTGYGREPAQKALGLVGSISALRNTSRVGSCSVHNPRLQPPMNYFVMLDHEQSAAQCDSLASAASHCTAHSRFGTIIPRPPRFHLFGGRRVDRRCAHPRLCESEHDLKTGCAKTAYGCPQASLLNSFPLGHPDFQNGFRTIISRQIRE